MAAAFSTLQPVIPDQADPANPTIEAVAEGGAIPLDQIDQSKLEPMPQSIPLDQVDPTKLSPMQEGDGAIPLDQVDPSKLQTEDQYLSAATRPEIAHWLKQNRTRPDAKEKAVNAYKAVLERAPIMGWREAGPGAPEKPTEFFKTLAQAGSAMLDGLAYTGEHLAPVIKDVDPKTGKYIFDKQAEELNYLELKQATSLNALRFADFIRRGLNNVTNFIDVSLSSDVRRAGDNPDALKQLDVRLKQRAEDHLTQDVAALDLEEGIATNRLLQTNEPTTNPQNVERLSQNPLLDPSQALMAAGPLLRAGRTLEGVRAASAAGEAMSNAARAEEFTARAATLDEQAAAAKRALEKAKTMTTADRADVAARALEYANEQQPGLLRKGVAETARLAAGVARKTENLIDSSPLVRGLVAGGAVSFAGGDPSMATLSALIGMGTPKLGLVHRTVGRMGDFLYNAGEGLAGRASMSPMLNFAGKVLDATGKEAGAFVASQVHGVPFLLAAQSPEERDGLIATNAVFHAAGYGAAKTAWAVDASLNVPKNFFAARTLSPSKRIDAKPLGFDPHLDAAHASAVAQADNTFNNFVAGIQDYFSARGKEAYLLKDADYATALENLVKQGALTPEQAQASRYQAGVTTDAFTGGDGRTRQVALSRVGGSMPGVSFGHEAVGHLLWSLASPEHRAKATETIEKVYGQQGLADAKAMYEANARRSGAPGDFQLTHDALIQEIFAENAGAVAHSLPIAKFGPELRGFAQVARDVYHIVGDVMETAGFRQPKAAPTPEVGSKVQFFDSGLKSMVEGTVAADLGGLFDVNYLNPETGDRMARRLGPDELHVFKDGKLYTPLGVEPSMKVAGLIENILQAQHLDADILGAEKPAPKTETSAKTESAAKQVTGEVVPVDPNATEIPGSRPVEPKAVAPGFKKGDPIEEVRNASGVVLAENAKVVRELGTVDGVKYYEIEYTHPDTGERKLGHVPESWLQSKPRPGVTYPKGYEHPITNQTPEGAFTAPEGGVEGQVAPKQTENVVRPQAETPNVRTTASEQNKFAQPATDEVHKANRAALETALQGPRSNRPVVETDYYSAKSPVQSPDATVREAQRKAADAAEKSGEPNPLRAIYQKVFVPYSWTPWKLDAETSQRLYGDAPRPAGGVYGMSMDKLIQNVDLLRGALALNPEARAAFEKFGSVSYLASDDLRAALQKYLENQSHGYSGDGKPLQLPTDTRPGSITPVDPNYTPHVLQVEERQLFNLLMGLEQQQSRTAGMEFAERMARLNDNQPTTVGLDEKGRELVDTNPLRVALKNAGFDPRILNTVVENLPTKNFTTPLKARPDLHFPAGDTGITAAGFMPDTPQSVRRARGNDETRSIAREYIRSSGIANEAHDKYATIDPERMKRIADYYDSAKHDPQNPEVQKAYDALTRETLAQYDAMVKAGIQVEPYTGKGEPYKNSTEMMRDVRENKHLYFLKTEGAFGEGAVDAGNPLLADSGRKIGDTPLLVNDVFRAVHDFFGHTADGYEFGPRGEYNAYLAHSRMFSDEAKPALAAETLAQNAWVNFGPHLRRTDGSLPVPGDADFKPLANRRFADQKTTIVPAEILNDVDSHGRAASYMPEFRLRAEDEGQPPEKFLSQNAWISPTGRFFAAGDHQDWAMARLNYGTEPKPDRSWGYENALKEKGWVRFSWSRIPREKTVYVSGRLSEKQKAALEVWQGLHPDVEVVGTGRRDSYYMPDVKNPTYSLMGKDGETLEVRGGSHAATAHLLLHPDAKTRGEALDRAFKDGYLRVTNQGSDLYVDTRGGQPTARQLRALKDIAIEHDKDRITLDTGEDYRTIWTRDEDSGGRFMPDTPEFKNWFGKSKVTDDKGTPRVVYHGTQRPDRVGTVFRKSRATSGPMAFFTTDPTIASNYATGKRDTSMTPPDGYAGWFKYKPEGSRSSVSIDRAWHFLSPEQRAKLTEAVDKVGYQSADDSSGPIVGNSQSIMGRDSVAYELKQAGGNALKALTEIWLNSGALFGEEEKFLDVLKAAGVDMSRTEYDNPNVARSAVYPVYLKIEHPLDTANIPDDVYQELIDAGEARGRRTGGKAVGGDPDQWDKNRVSGEEWAYELQDDRDNETSYAWTHIPDWATEILKKRGYDGIQDTGGKYTGVEHGVWVPFEETQVKSAIANKGMYDPAKRDIRYMPQAGGPREERKAPTGWVLPGGKYIGASADAQGRFTNTGDFHGSHLAQNLDQYKKQFGLNEPDRLEALKKGFVRVRYDANTGRLGVEAVAPFKGRERAAVEQVIEDNIDRIDRVDVNLFNKKGEVIDQNSESVFRLSGLERSQAAMDALRFMPEENVFDSVPLYHGTRSKKLFEGKANYRAGEGMYGNVVYLTANKEEASGYSTMDSDRRPSRVVEVRADLRKPADLFSKIPADVFPQVSEVVAKSEQRQFDDARRPVKVDETWSLDDAYQAVATADGIDPSPDTQKLNQVLKDAGYDGLWAKSSKGGDADLGDWVMPFSTENVKRVDNGARFMPDVEEWGKYWLDPQGKLHDVEDHEPGAAKLLGKNHREDDPWMDRHTAELQKKGWVRVSSDDEKVFVTRGTPGQPTELNKAQRQTLEDQSFNGFEVVDANSPRERTIFPAQGGPKFMPETPAFKKWFGESKVVDDSGEPLRVYHGTHVYTDPKTGKSLGNATVFDRNYSREFFGRAPSWDNIGTWFTTEPDSASKYGPAVMPTYLSIEKPLTITGNASADPSSIQWASKRLMSLVKEAGGPDEFVANAKASGYDGVLLQDDRLDHLPGDVWIAFDPEQIKSATGNRGTFDPKNPDIRFMAEPATLADFNAKDVSEALKRPGWAILTATREAAGAPDAKANIDANIALEAELKQRQLPYQVVGGLYNGVDQGKNFLVIAPERTGLELGKKYGQESILTNRGYLYQDDTIAPLVHSNTIVGPDALKQPGYSVLQDGTPFSAGIEWGKRVPNHPETSAMRILYDDTGLQGPASGKQSNSGVARQLQAAVIERWGGEKITSDTITPEQESKIVDQGTAEVEAALNATGHAGNWYTTEIGDALEAAKVIHPELADDRLAAVAGMRDAKGAQLAMSLAMAITSQNMTVPQNVVYAHKQFEILKKTGKFDPTMEIGAKGDSISSNLEFANNFIAKFGWDGLENFIKRDFTVRDLEREASSMFGEEVAIAGRKDDIVQGAAVFGPKIGQGFLQNLRGNFWPVTVDLWLRRTWGRWTGNVLGDGVTAPRLARLVDAARERGIELPDVLKSLRPVGEGKKRTFTARTADRIESDHEAHAIVNDFARRVMDRWKDVYGMIHGKKVGLADGSTIVAGGKMTQEQYQAVVDGRMTLEQVASRLQADYNATERAWDRLKVKPKGKGAKAQYFDAADKRAGRTVSLSNEEISDRKPEWAKAADVILDQLNPIDAPSDLDRAVISRVINSIRERLEKKGFTTTNADIQAILWYPEKDIWAKLRGEKESNLKNSYGQEFLNLAEELGVGDQARRAVERARAARAGVENDAKANDGVRRTADGAALADQVVPFPEAAKPLSDVSLQPKAAQGGRLSDTRL